MEPQPAGLWKKGETSGHEQIVDSIFVNCELNSLLVTVRQVGAVCHDGYPTCYYRKLEPDNSLTIVRERAFDPAVVYPAQTVPALVEMIPDEPDDEPLDTKTRRWYGAYQYLADNDLEADSQTSKRLRDPNSQLHMRVADELTELGGVLNGTHGHANAASDVVLEGSQALYWLALLAIRAGVSWRSLRPDRALVTTDEQLSKDSAARMVISEALYWSHGPGDPATIGVRCHAAMALVAQACRSAGIFPVSLIRRDLTDLESKPYLAPYFDGLK